MRELGIEHVEAQLALVVGVAGLDEAPLDVVVGRSSRNLPSQIDACPPSSHSSRLTHSNTSTHSSRLGSAYTEPRSPIAPIACSQRQILTRTDAGLAGIVGMNSTQRAPLVAASAPLLLRLRAIARIIRHSAGHHGAVMPARGCARLRA
jgi:hypothetical protein